MTLHQPTPFQHPRLPVTAHSGFWSTGNTTPLNEVLHSRKGRRVAVMASSHHERAQGPNAFPEFQLAEEPA